MPGSMIQMMTFVSFIVPLGMMVGWVILLVVAWRFMRAHEAMADTLRSLEAILKELAENLKTKD
ncbi:MAG: hypothetical protein ACPL5F_12120 [Moorellaceae bacterium]